MKTPVIGRIGSPDEPVQIGDLLGQGLEPGLVIGRVCGIEKETGRILYRTYRSQTEKWPTGPFYATKLPWPVYPNSKGIDVPLKRVIK